MPGKPVEFHPEALEEAEAAIRWYRERSEPAAVGFKQAVIRLGFGIRPRQIGLPDADVLSLTNRTAYGR